MNWADLLSTDRPRPDDGIIILTPSHTPNDGVRSDFHADYDRVVFSSSFRKLGRKTQVHPFAKSDHTHNRLTHSVEVASVGRSLGNGVGLGLHQRKLLPDHISPSDIGTLVQVACLAHDLGNPPFGHTGEDALREWFCQNDEYLQSLSPPQKTDLTTYEGNAHSLRIVARTEMYAHAGGMRLTCASLGTLLKYPWGSEYGDGKFNIYQSELPLMRMTAERLGLPPLGVDRWARHPLSYLMEAADDICYALLDLEDAVELELISFDEFSNVMRPILGADFENYKNINDKRQRIGVMRGRAIGNATHEVAKQFFEHHDALLAGEFDQKDLLAVCDDSVKQTLQNAKNLAKNQIFNHHSKLVTEIASFGCLGQILDLLVPAVHAKLTGKTTTTKHRLALELLKDTPIKDTDTLYDGYMKVLDFMGGLTDNSAGRLARELSGVGLG
ncbi:deoxyguanosinetriphosphate triphosphohydrolase [Moraxella sp. ZY200743]|uniref:deoxyguanosinetriphosphate triphosphohydrolase n=1 Tax=Moraxella sp. ZY200743 TaxID=2911970 RepID=UPI003D7CE20D